MPIFAPLTESKDIAVHIIITVYQTASGLVNLITPTSAVVMGGLAISGIGYNKWLRFVWKPLLSMFVFSTIVIIIATII